MKTIKEILDCHCEENACSCRQCAKEIESDLRADLKELEEQTALHKVHCCNRPCEDCGLLFGQTDYIKLKLGDK